MELLDNLPNTEYVSKYYRRELIDSDYDDNKYSDCAISCNADYLATNDKHFAVLKKIKFPKVNVINSDELKMLINK